MKPLLHKLREHPLFIKYINRETISYGLAGLLTTLVNFISYELLYQIGLSNLLSNGLAWFIAVTFAYIANKWKVFRSRSESTRDETVKLVKFFAARGLTLGLEQLGMYILVELLGINRWIIKGSLGILVIILNYIFSKLYIFNTNNHKEE